MQRIPNPHPSAGLAGRIQSNLDQTIFNYFFRYIYPGDRGNRQALINTFFQAFYDACITDGISANYDPTGESHKRVLAILARINFKDVRGNDKPGDDVHQGQPGPTKGQKPRGTSKVRGKDKE